MASREDDSPTPSISEGGGAGVFSAMLNNDLEWLGERIIMMANEKDILRDNADVDGEARSMSAECIEHWTAFERFFGLYTNPADFGRIYNTRELCRICITIISASLSDRELPLQASCCDSMPVDLRKLAAKPLEMWKTGDWEDFVELLEDMQDSLHRSDATADVFVGTGKVELDAMRDMSPSGKHLPQQSKLAKIKDLVRVVKATLPIRIELMNRKKKNGDTFGLPSVQKRLIDQLWRTANKTINADMKDVLLSLFDKKTIPITKRSSKSITAPDGLTLRPVSDLEEMFRGIGSLSLDKLRDKILTLLRCWYTERYTRPPVLNGSYSIGSEAAAESKNETTGVEGVGDTSISDRDAGALASSSSKVAVMPSRKASVKGMDIPDDISSGGDSTVNSSEIIESPSLLESPLPDPAKSGLVGRNNTVDDRKKPSSRGKKKPPPEPSDGTENLPFSPSSLVSSRRDPYLERAVARRGIRLEFDDSDDGSDEDDNLHDRKRAAAPTSGDDEEYRIEGKRRKSQRKKYDGRRKWTEEEKFAIREGCRSIGVSKWKEIKEAYWSVLSDRTSSQIKDCYRTMKKNGEI